MKTLEIKNIYGYPALTPAIEKWIEQRKYRMIVGVTDLLKLPGNDDKPTVVLCNLAMLHSFNIPVLGYYMQPNGVWAKTAMPEKLEPNKVKVKIFKIGKPLPSSKKLYNFYTKGKTDDTFPSRFVSEQKRESLDERVFAIEGKRIKAVDAAALKREAEAQQAKVKSTKKERSK